MAGEGEGRSNSAAPFGLSERQGALTRDAIAQFLLPPEEPRAATFRLDGREHLCHVQVAQSDVSAYRALLPQGGVR